MTFEIYTAQTPLQVISTNQPRVVPVVLNSDATESEISKINPTGSSAPESPGGGEQDLSGSGCSGPVSPDRTDSNLAPTRYGDWEKNGRCIDF